MLVKMRRQNSLPLETGGFYYTPVNEEPLNRPTPGFGWVQPKPPMSFRIPPRPPPRAYSEDIAGFHYQPMSLAEFQRLPQQMPELFAVPPRDPYYYAYPAARDMGFPFRRHVRFQQPAEPPTGAIPTAQTNRYSSSSDSSDSSNEYEKVIITRKRKI